jgi:hypothetical protein
MLTPIIRPISRPHIPAALTTVSQRTVPRSVTTAQTRFSLISKPVTRVFCSTLAPRFIAPLASAMVSPLGSAWPSEGMKAAPMIPYMSRIGKSFSASEGVIICISRPKLRAVVAPFFNSKSRSFVPARCRQPQRFQPVVSPVSASSVS